MTQLKDLQLGNSLEDLEKFVHIPDVSKKNIPR